MEEENKVVDEVKEEVVKEDKPNKKSKLPIIIIIILLLVGVGVGGFFIAKKIYDKPSSDTKEESKKEEDNTLKPQKPAYDEHTLDECKDILYYFKYLKLNKDTNVFEAHLSSIDEMKEAIQEYFDSDGAYASCLSIDITAEVKYTDITQVLEYKVDSGSWTASFLMHNETLFYVDLSQPLPDFELKGNNLYITFYSCDVGDGCPIYYILDSNRKLTEDKLKNEEYKEKQKEYENDRNNDQMEFTKNGIEAVKFWLGIDEVYPEHYFSSNAKVTGECYINNGTDTQPDYKLKDNCEEIYEFSDIKDLNIVFKFTITNGKKALYYNNKQVEIGHYNLIKIDGTYYFVMLDGYTNGHLYLMSLDGKIINKIDSRANVTFTKLNGKPIMLFATNNSYHNMEDADLKLSYVFIGDNKVYNLVDEVKEGQYVDITLTSAVW